MLSRLQPLEEAEIVLDMLEHVDRHQHVEALLVLGQQVAETEGQPVLRLAAAKLEGLRRDLIAIELLVAAKGMRQDLEDFTRAAAGLAKAREHHAIALEDRLDVRGFPRRILLVPGAVAGEIGAVGVDAGRIGQRCRQALVGVCMRVHLRADQCALRNDFGDSAVSARM